MSWYTAGLPVEELDVCHGTLLGYRLKECIGIMVGHGTVSGLQVEELYGCHGILLGYRLRTLWAS